MQQGALLWLGQVILQVLGHRETFDLLRAEHRLHSLVWGEELFVLRVL